MKKLLSLALVAMALLAVSCSKQKEEEKKGPKTAQEYVDEFAGLVKECSGLIDSGDFSKAEVLIEKITDMQEKIDSLSTVNENFGKEFRKELLVKIKSDPSLDEAGNKVFGYIMKSEMSRELE